MNDAFDEGCQQIVSLLSDLANEHYAQILFKNNNPTTLLKTFIADTDGVISVLKYRATYLRKSYNENNSVLENFALLVAAGTIILGMEFQTMMKLAFVQTLIGLCPHADQGGMNSINAGTQFIENELWPIVQDKTNILTQMLKQYGG